MGSSSPFTLITSEAERPQGPPPPCRFTLHHLLGSCTRSAPGASMIFFVCNCSFYAVGVSVFIFWMEAFPLYILCMCCCQICLEFRELASPPAGAQPFISRGRETGWGKLQFPFSTGNPGCTFASHLELPRRPPAPQGLAFPGEPSPAFRLPGRVPCGGPEEYFSKLWMRI